MDWKKIIGYGLFIAFLIGLYFYQRPIYTSYQEVISELIGENETVEKIAGYTGSDLLDQKATFIIEDQELINSLLNMDIKL